jgi:hypothetical protein
MTTESQLPCGKFQREERLPSEKNAGGDLLKWVIVWIWGTFMARVPIGYEDEAGFHFGTEPVC